MKNQEIRQIIDHFPNYEISNYGRVFNISTQRIMVLSPTLQGDLTVGLTRNNHQYRRSVKVLVARAFVPGEDEVFNTPIQLDGNKKNLHEDNILWRPRWFAWEYTRQFVNPPHWFNKGPVIDLISQAIYNTIFEAAITNGTLCKDISDSILKESRVFPTGELYEFTKFI